MGSVVVIAAEAAAYVLPANAAKRCCHTDKTRNILQQHNMTHMATFTQWPGKRESKRAMTSYHQQHDVHGEQEEQRGQQRGGGGAGLGGRASILRTVPGVFMSFNTQNPE